MDVHEEAKEHPQNAKEGSKHEQTVSVEAQKLDASQIGKLQIGFASDLLRRCCKSCALTKQEQCGNDAGNSAPARRKQITLHTSSHARSSALGGKLLHGRSTGIGTQHLARE